MSDAEAAALSEPVLSNGEAALYGLIQGLTEFLPVSSSGHLALAHNWGLGSLPPDQQLPFDVLLHAATLIAIVAAFWREILHACNWRNGLAARILIAILPAGLVGLFGKDAIEAAGDSFLMMGLCYLFTAALLTVSESLSLRRGDGDQTAAPPLPDGRTVTWRAAIIVGLLQVTGLFPGVSRSGSTVAAGLLAGLRPATAVAFSFLVGLPLIAGAAAKDALDGGFGRLLDTVGWLPLTIAFGTSLLVGVAAIVLLKIVATAGKLRWFAAYCLLVAAVCLYNAL